MEFIMRLAKLITLSFSLLLMIMICTPVGYFILDNSAVKPVINTNKPSGMIAYLINLDRSKKRLAYVLPKLKELDLPLERIAAVDGVKLSKSDIKHSVDLEAYHNFLGHNPRMGTIGCSLSHIKAWQALLASDKEFAIIFEDDVSFDPIQVKQAIDDLLQIPQDWDIANLETYHSGMPLTIKTFSNHTRMVVYLTEITHAGSYIINRTAAERLLQKALPIKIPVDHYFARSWEFNLKFVGIEPRLVKQGYGDSEIEVTKRNHYEHPSKNIFQTMHKIIYKFQSYIIRFLYNLKIYLTS
jgi:glycosyl transferase family 25